jgi:hypothetical protein
MSTLGISGTTDGSVKVIPEVASYPINLMDDSVNPSAVRPAGEACNRFNVSAIGSTTCAAGGVGGVTACAVGAVQKRRIANTATMSSERGSASTVVAPNIVIGARSVMLNV